jgi:hypothetical protein
MRFLHAIVRPNGSSDKKYGYEKVLKAFSECFVINFRVADLFDTVEPWASLMVTDELQ